MYAANKDSGKALNSNNSNQEAGGQVLNPRDSRQHEIEQIFGQQFTSGDRLKYLQAYAEIAVFLDDTAEVTRGLQALNVALVTWCDANDKHGNLWRLRLFLREFEQAAGFNLGDRSGLLEPGLIVLDEEHQEIMLRGFLDRDRFMRLIAAGANWDDPSVAGFHGALTHRIQWWLIHWALNGRFEELGVRLVDLYREIGSHLWPDPSPISPNSIFYMGFKYGDQDWTAPAKNWSLWDYLVDLPEFANSARCPDFIGLKFFIEKGVGGVEELRKAVSAHAEVADARKKELMPSPPA